MSGAQHLLVCFDADARYVLSRVVGLLRRRNLTLQRVVLGPGPDDGASQLRMLVETDRADAERIVQLFQKIIGVQDATTAPADRTLTREVALVRLDPAGAAQAELLDVLQLFHATLLDEGPEGVVAEVTGTESFVRSCIRALERFGIADIAWGGGVSIERAPAPALASPHLQETGS